VIPRWLVVALVVVVTVAWLANLIVGWRDPHNSEPAVNTIFMVIIGSLFALDREGPISKAISRWTGKGKRSEDDDS
jgi:fructose-specific phosphotransferase system IIC component